MNLLHKLFRRITGYVIVPKIINETPESWAYDAEGTFYQFPRSCQIEGLSQIIEGCFGRDTNRVVLEIGAYDGFTFSNTWGLLHQGWKGILIEPVQDYFDLARRNIARFQNATVYCFALGEMTGETNFYKLGPYTSRSHSQVTTIYNSSWYEDHSTIEEITVDMVSIEDFVLRYLDRVPDLVVIDVEGYELPIVSSLLSKGIYPQMMISELNGMADGDADYELHSLLIAGGYIRIWRDSINAIYVLSTISSDRGDASANSLRVWTRDEHE